MENTQFAELASQHLRAHLDALRESAPSAERRDNEIVAIRSAIGRRSREHRRRRLALCVLVVTGTVSAAGLARVWQLNEMGPRLAVTGSGARVRAQPSGLVIDVEQGARVALEPDEPGTLVLSRGAANVRLVDPLGGLRVRTPDAEVDVTGAAVFAVQVALARSGCAGTSTLVDLRAGALHVSWDGRGASLTAPVRWDSCVRSTDPGLP